MTKPAVPMYILQNNWISRLNLATTGCESCIEVAGTESVVVACWMGMLQSIWCFSYLPLNDRQLTLSFPQKTLTPLPGMALFFSILFVSVWANIFALQHSLQNLKCVFSPFLSFKMSYEILLRLKADYRLVQSVQLVPQPLFRAVFIEIHTTQRIHVSLIFCFIFICTLYVASALLWCLGI